MSSNLKKIDTLSFESALEELEAIVSALENGSLSLEDAIESYTRGSQLKNHCEKKLKQARLKVEKLQIQQDGNIDTESM